MLRPKPVEERRIEQIIERGGQPQKSEDDEKLMLVQLRLGSELVKRIDAKRKEKLVPPSRHAWILEAIMEKL